MTEQEMKTRYPDQYRAVVLKRITWHGVIKKGDEAACAWFPTRMQAERYRDIFSPMPGDAKVVSRKFFYDPQGREWDPHTQHMVRFDEQS